MVNLLSRRSRGVLARPLPVHRVMAPYHPPAYIPSPHRPIPTPQLTKSLKAVPHDIACTLLLFNTSWHGSLCLTSHWPPSWAVEILDTSSQEPGDAVS